MSTATNQSLCILSFINATFITITEDKFLPTVEYAKEVCQKIIRDFPESGNTIKNHHTILNWMYEINHELPERKGMYTSLLLSNISSLLITDLMERIKDKKKLRMLEELKEVCIGLNDQLDPNGAYFDSIEKAEELNLVIKNIIEW